MDFEKRATAFRAAVAQLGPRRRNTPYPARLRPLAVAYVRARLAGGTPLGDAAHALGLGTDTVRRWLSSSPRRERPVAAVRPVQILAPAVATTAGLVLHCPGGLRVEGLDSAALADLLRRLA